MYKIKMYKIKLFFYPLLALPAIVVFFLISGEDRHKTMMDLYRWEKVRGMSHIGPAFWRLYKMLVAAREFRSLYYVRIGYFSKIVKYFLPGMTTCGIGSTLSKNLGGGCYIQHGWGMELNAESVGVNLWINQNVTVGYKGANGHPKIGNNVSIGTGAVVLGGITIGNNVKIGANAIVVDDVPDNCTVCSPKASVVRYHNDVNMKALTHMGGVKC